MVATNYVISAAHCFLLTDREERITKFYKASEFVVVIGDDDISVKDEEKPLKTIETSIIQYIFPEEYVLEVGEFVVGYPDIVILKLKDRIDIEIYTPACLARTVDEHTFYNKRAWVAGWGALEGERENEVLKGESDKKGILDTKNSPFI